MARRSSSPFRIPALATVVSVAGCIQVAVASISSTPRALQDFAWGITPLEGLPIINFDNDSTQNEVQFSYTFDGTLSDNKFLEVHIFQDDCKTPADESLVFADWIMGNEISIDVDIIQETITDSVHYFPIDQTTAEIRFCARVDYNYKDLNGNVESFSHQC